MRLMQNPLTLVATPVALSTVGMTAHGAHSTVQPGPRPFYLVDQLEEGGLKHKLEACMANIRTYTHHDFSIGHRGAALRFPEHTVESYEAGRRMGAGVLECDVTFTNDGDILRTIDVLAQDVVIIGLFSDWPATTTFYANCLK
jgi:glycerophosphoryl diester phosphodiesterase